MNTDRQLAASLNAPTLSVAGGMHQMDDKNVQARAFDTIPSQNFNFCCFTATAYVRWWNSVQFCSFNLANIDNILSRVSADLTSEFRLSLQAVTARSLILFLQEKSECFRSVVSCQLEAWQPLSSVPLGRRLYIHRDSTFNQHQRI